MIAVANKGEKSRFDAAALPLKHGR
jgi:hypothetical protein